MLRGATTGEISQRFHDGLVEALMSIARVLRKRTSLNTVCLSGGTFQNTCLANGLEHQLRSEGFEVYTHSQVPAGDGGISLGQAVVATHRVGSEDLSSRSATDREVEKFHKRVTLRGIRLIATRPIDNPDFSVHRRAADTAIPGEFGR
jgi:predicted NodU family carbamoyl transferase